MSTLDDLAEALAEDVLKAVDTLGDQQIIQDVAVVLAATSTPTEEAFLGAVRVRQAERRGRAFLTKYIEKAIKERSAKDQV